MIHESYSEKETRGIAQEIARKAKPGEIYCLMGELGAGKTVFAKGFAEGLGVTAAVTSPTFTIVNEYMGRLPFYHFDVYRMESEADMADTGYEEYFYGDGVCLVEWAELVRGLIPSEAAWIMMEKDSAQNEGYRRIQVGEQLS